MPVEATEPRYWVDGREGAGLPADDRGLQFGDGLFETMIWEAGRVPLWRRHLARLERGCRLLGLEMPEESLLLGDLALLPRDGRAVLKLVLTRGSSARGYRIPPGLTTRRILGLHAHVPWPEAHATHGVAVRICSTRLSCNVRLAGVKHLNRLEQVLARAEWQDPLIAEGLMLDTDGRLVEGTMSNLFLIRGDELITSPLVVCGVAGIMRELVLEHAAAVGLLPRFADFGLEVLAQADAAFLSNSLYGVWPIREVLGATPVPMHVSPVMPVLRAALAADAPWLRA